MLTRDGGSLKGARVANAAAVELTLVTEGSSLLGIKSDMTQRASAEFLREISVTGIVMLLINYCVWKTEFLPGLVILQQVCKCSTNKYE